MTERLKAMLRWSFDDNGGIDAEMFATILQHEGVKLSGDESAAVVTELTREAQGLVGMYGEGSAISHLTNQLLFLSA